jgi:general secretion pathway protein G
MKRLIELLKTRRDRRRTGAHGAEGGMTLLEIMIVLAILAGMVTVVGLVGIPQYKKAQLKTAKEGARQVAQAVERYMLNNNSTCPTSVDDLVAQKELPRKIKDPWGQDYVMHCPGTANTDGVDVLSMGPDKQEGTADDQKSWE